MKIVVTGGLGHIGSKLIRKLPFNFSNIEIVIVDNLLTQRYYSLFNLPDRGKYSFIKADITKDNLEKIFDDVFIVIHLAAITDATSSFENRKIVEKNNFICTKKIANICLIKKIPMLTLSTTSVYGDQERIVDENCSIENLKPQSPYAETKLKEENYLKKLNIEYGLMYTSLRFGTIFGVSPGMRFHTAVNKFCLQAVMGIPLTIWKTAFNQKRPYLELDDAINSIIFFMKKNIFEGETFNVVTCNASVNEIVTILKKNVKKLEIEFVESQVMNQLSYSVSNSKIKAKGFKFTGKLEMGILETIKTLKNLNFNNKLL